MLMNFLVYYGERIRYLVHEMISVCSACETESSSSDIQKTGNKYICPKCGEGYILTLIPLAILELASSSQTARH